MIHQAKSNRQLLDEQIFSERLASAILLLAHLRHADRGERCPLSEITRKTNALTKFFRLRPNCAC
jgi:hypothetical protein